jgi:hypothetical protein
MCLNQPTCEKKMQKGPNEQKSRGRIWSGQQAPEFPRQVTQRLDLAGARTKREYAVFKRGSESESPTESGLVQLAVWAIDHRAL